MLDQAQLQLSINEALRAHDAPKLSTLRLIKVALQNEVIKLGHPLSDSETQMVLRRELKKREESITAFTAVGRMEMAELERVEAVLLSSYLPAQISSDEIRSIAQSLILEQSGTPQAGPLTGQVMKKLAGQADGSEVSRIVQELLS